MVNMPPYCGFSAEGVFVAVVVAGVVVEGLDVAVVAGGAVVVAVGDDVVGVAGAQAVNTIRATVKQLANNQMILIFTLLILLLSKNDDKIFCSGFFTYMKPPRNVE